MDCDVRVGIWSPMWIVDLLLLWIAISLLFEKTPPVEGVIRFIPFCHYH